METITRYFKDSIAEFNNITWPTRNQAVRISVIVLAFMAVSAIALGALDQVLVLGYQALLKLPK
ncbi:preprotein translocase subunit SecE [Candidatus Peregrinibacteria bacterium]|nr:preprotein translocase subunit SecE [Candidatus Peregrinibacteria bacterium]